MYQYASAFEKCVEYFEGDELAAKVFLDKYALKDNNSNLLEETPVDMHRRLAKEFARIEDEKYTEALSEEQIFSLFDKFKYFSEFKYWNVRFESKYLISLKMRSSVFKNDSPWKYEILLF